jgi:transposase
MEADVEVEAEVTGSRTGCRKGARSELVEVVTRGERRRTWSADQKRMVVVEAMQPGARPAEVMRRWGISSGLFYDWRRQVLSGALGPVPVPTSFAELEVAAPAALDVGTVPQAASEQAPDQHGGNCRPARQWLARIEVVLPCGTLLRFDETISVDALRRVLAAVRAR